jgi:hypothetical protein
MQDRTKGTDSVTILIAEMNKKEIRGLYASAPLFRNLLLLHFPVLCIPGSLILPEYA